jgi:succinyl-diaminopimelate desuccinylase
VWWGEIETLGRTAHGSMPFLGTSAIRNMAAFLARVESDLYPKLDARTTAMPVIPGEARRSTLNLNSLHGGQPEPQKGDLAMPRPMVADSCRVMLDRRFLIEESAESVRAEVAHILETLKAEQPGFDYKMTDVMTVPPVMTDAGAPVVQALNAAVEKVLGKKPRHVVSPGTYDQKHLARIANLRDCVAYGPGILKLAHQPDEYLVIDDMVQSAQVMAAAARALTAAA